MDRDPISGDFQNTPLSFEKCLVPSSFPAFLRRLKDGRVCVSRTIASVVRCLHILALLAYRHTPVVLPRLSAKFLPFLEFCGQPGNARSLFRAILSQTPSGGERWRKVRKLFSLVDKIVVFIGIPTEA